MPISPIIPQDEATFSVLNEIYKKLKTDGFDVYFQGQHVGQCKDTYIVVAPNGGNQYSTFSTIQFVYDVQIYTPPNKIHKFEPFLRTVRESLKAIFPLIKETGYESPAFYDDDVKALMISLEYTNYGKLNRL